MGCFCGRSIACKSVYENNKDQICDGGYLFREGREPRSWSGSRGLNSIYFDMSSWIVVDNQVGILYYSLPIFFIKNHKREWICIEVRLPPVHFYLLKGLAFFTSFFSLCHFQCLPAPCYDRKARREREKGEVLWKQRNMFERNWQREYIFICEPVHHKKW